MTFEAFNRLLKSRYYPRSIQLINLIVFSFVVSALLFGSILPEENFGSIITWILWWPLIPLTFIFFGRMWCAICPFAAIGDTVQAYKGFNRPVPSFIKKYGIWIMSIGLISITWYDLTYGLVNAVRATAGFFLLLIVTSITISMLFARRAWCRYICPLGSLFGNYAQFSFIELRATQENCAKCTAVNCYKGNESAAGCPLHEVPRSMDSNRSCVLCGNCHKSCKNDSPQVKIRDNPGIELWTRKKPRLDEAVLIGSLIGIILISGFGMLEAWDPFFKSFQAILGVSNKKTTITILYFLILSIPIILMLLAGYISGKTSEEKPLESFSRYAYGFIPLNFAGHIAHNMFHFLGEGKRIWWSTMQILGVTDGPLVSIEGHGTVGAISPSALLDSATIQKLQYIIVLAGILFSVYVIYKTSKNSNKSLSTTIPHLALVLLFGIATIVLFAMPMGMRH